jgi:hypothetical protein
MRSWMVLATIVAAGCAHVTDSSAKSPVEVAGTVYLSFPMDASHPINPVIGATVSTSLDAVTTITDANGKFDLKTSTVLSGNCVPYTVTIAVSGSNVFSLAAAWGASAVGEQIILFPQLTQTFTASGCTSN